MFWKKGGESKAMTKKKKEVMKIESSALWGYMVSKHGVVVDVLQNLRRVESDGLVDGEPVTVVRIFDPATTNERGVDVEDYHSLDDHPELILYEGYYRPDRGQATDIHVEQKNRL